MGQAPSHEPIYVLGRSREETARLQSQAAFVEPFTERLFRDAGITPGMKVLDIGSGAGDVALLAARLVGPKGSVLSVDANPAIVETARARARDAGTATSRSRPVTSGSWLWSGISTRWWVAMS